MTAPSLKAVAALEATAERGATAEMAEMAAMAEMVAPARAVAARAETVPVAGALGARAAAEDQPDKTRSPTSMAITSPVAMQSTWA